MTKINKISKNTYSILKDKNIDLNIDDIFLDTRNNNLLKITDIKNDKYNNIVIYCDQSIDDNGNEWEYYSSIEFRSFESFIKIKGNISDFRKNAQDVIEGKIDILSLMPNQSNDINEETALVGKNSKESLILLQSDLEKRKKDVEIIKAFVSYEMELKRKELENIRSKLNNVLETFKIQITRIMRVITSIELYLGIDEEIFQIQEGNKAPLETPITFRQRILYMDEEVANTDDEGIDFETINLFDEWLLKNDNYKLLLPEEKGVVVLNPRRYEKKYASNDMFANAKNVENRKTYLLIRNGECLYRIFTEKIHIYPRLFPKKTELMDIIKNIEKNESYFSKEEAKKMLEDETYNYKKRALLMQGLIDRTDILHPIQNGISIFKMDETPNAFNFIYDDDNNALPSGRLSFKEWQKEINSKIYKGSRIIISGYYSEYFSYKDKTYFTHDRLCRYYNNDYNIPNPPSQGIYEIDHHKEIDHQHILKSKYNSNNGKILRDIDVDTYLCEYEKITNVILYNPKDVKYRGWNSKEETERKNRLKFKLYDSDTFVLNYDQISLDDINFYLQNRTDRPNYLHMMPLLRTMKKWRLEEIEKEKAFATMIVSNLNNSVTLDNVMKCIEWWKFKNKIKRPIDRDDTKAFRMIIKKLKKNG